MLDLEVVNQYDSDIYHEAIQIFIEDTANVLRQIEVSLDLDSKKKLAHRLKGACLMIGARTCADCAQKVEHASDLESADKRMLDLIAEHQKLIAYLSANYQ